MAKQQTYEIPVIENTNDLDNLIQSCYTLEFYMTTPEIYEDFFQKMYSIIKGCIEKKECREYPVTFKFYSDDKVTHTVQLRHFIINMILWEPFVHVSSIKFLNEKYIMDGTKIMLEPEYDLDEWINEKIIITLRNFNVKEVTINQSISNVCNKLRGISLDFSLIMNLNFSYYTFIEMYQKYPRIKEIMECTFPETMQPHEIEDTIDRYLNEEVEIYMNDPGNPIGTILRAKTGIKHDNSLCQRIVICWKNLFNCWDILIFYILRQSAAKY